MKQKTKKMLKIQSIMLIILILFQFIFSSVPSFASTMELSPELQEQLKEIIEKGEIEVDENGEITPEGREKLQEMLENGELELDGEEEETSPLDVILGIVDGIVGIFLNIFNIVPVLIGGIIQGAATSVASIGGRTDLAS